MDGWSSFRVDPVFVKVCLAARQEEGESLVTIHAIQLPYCSPVCCRCCCWDDGMGPSTPQKHLSSTPLWCGIALLLYSKRVQRIGAGGGGGGGGGSHEFFVCAPRGFGGFLLSHYNITSTTTSFTQSTTPRGVIVGGGVSPFLTKTTAAPFLLPA